MGLIPPEEEDKIFNMLTEQVDSTLSLLTNLAEWGRLDLMPKKIDVNELGLNSLVEKCFAELAINIAAKQNETKNNTDSKVYLPVDENSLQFILRNLITNANKFTENGVITVTNSHKSITVCDTGKGMTSQQAEALLGDKQHNSTAGTRNEHGTGLGLMLIKDFLRKVGGKLAVESELGKGTSISIVFK